MIGTTQSPILQLIRQAVQDPRDHRFSDRELVHRFHHGRDEAAFQALLRRHGPMVLDLCQSLLHNEADAEDAFQATFLILAHKAGTIRRHASVGSWLYGVAYRTVLKARAEFGRRRKHESLALEAVSPFAADDLSWRDVRQVVHEELNRFAERYRAPLILCYLEGQSQQEAALRLGISEAALKKRLERGRALLRARLVRRGLGPAGALLASPWPGAAAAASLSPTLVSVTVTAALRIVAGQTAGVVSAPVAALTGGVLKMMTMSQLKCVVGILTAAIAAIGSVAFCLTVGATPSRTDEAMPQADARPETVSVVNQRALQNPQRDLDEPARGMALELRGEAMALLFNAREKLDAAPDVPSRLRHRTLMDMAVVQKKLGDLDGALKTFQRVREIIEQQPSPDGERRMLARAFARAGEVDEAMALTRNISEEGGRGGQGLRDTSYQEVAKELAKAGLEKEALRATDSIAKIPTREWAQSMVLREIGLHHARKGEMNQALQTLKRIVEPSQQVQLLAGLAYFNYSFTDLPHEKGIAQLQADQGDRAAALKTLTRAAEIIADIEKRPELAHLSLACAQARLGDLAAAQKSADGITHPVGKGIALAAIARGQIRSGQAKEAQATIAGIADKSQKVHVLMHVAMELSKSGDRVGIQKSFQACDELLSGMDENERLVHFHNLVSARATAGNFRAAQLTAAASGRDATIAIANIAHSQAQAGDIQGALETASRFKENEWRRGMVLRGIATAQMERGAVKDLARNREDIAHNFKGAMQWIRSLPSDLDQADALLGLAEGLLKRSELIAPRK